MSAKRHVARSYFADTVWDAAERRCLQRRLLRWFGGAARDLPWRRSRDPYAVWISEIMLQQTQVATVIPYFERFLRQFPDIATLAAAPESLVLRHWEGLGYYRRARQLHEAAKRLVGQHGGQFPRDVNQVRALPGIGRYTAGAILSIACDARLPILEANTVRLLSRLAGSREDPHTTAGQQRLWQMAESLLPNKNCGAFNKALMELGSLVCTPRQPRCDECPLRPHCRAFAARLQEQIPLAKTKPAVEDLRQAALVIRRGGRVLLWQWQPGERWAGLWDFPRLPSAAKPSQADLAALNDPLTARTGLATSQLKPSATTKNSVTRFRISLDCSHAFAFRGRLARKRSDLRFVRLTELDEYPLSTTGRKISRMIAR